MVNSCSRGLFSIIKLIFNLLILFCYKNKTFGELFNYLSTERYLIPLGLYRLTGALDNEHAYVFTLL